MLGYVYVMTNETMPGLVKVGMTFRSPAERADELRSTGNAGRFIVAYELELDDPNFVEREAHKLLDECCVEKEWFRCSVGVAVSALHHASGMPGGSLETMSGFARRSPGPMDKLSPEEQEVWKAYYRREREALARLGRGRDAAEQRAWSEYVKQELRAADDERTAAMRKLRDGS